MLGPSERSAPCPGFRGRGGGSLELFSICLHILQAYPLSCSGVIWAGGLEPSLPDGSDHVV